ncbi:hypothetical protein IWZ00DRAFT_52787 [Phyllosticta capitalensis]
MKACANPAKQTAVSIGKSLAESKYEAPLGTHLDLQQVSDLESPRRRPRRRVKWMHQVTCKARCSPSVCFLKTVNPQPHRPRLPTAHTQTQPNTNQHVLLPPPHPTQPTTTTPSVTMSKRRRIFGSTDTTERDGNNGKTTTLSSLTTTTDQAPLTARIDATITNQAALIASQRQYIHDILSNISQLDGFAKAHAAITEARVEELRARVEELARENEELKKGRGEEGGEGGDGEVETLRERVRELEEEVERLREAQTQTQMQTQHGELAFRGRGD